MLAAGCRCDPLRKLPFRPRSSPDPIKLSSPGKRHMIPIIDKALLQRYNSRLFRLASAPPINADPASASAVIPTFLRFLLSHHMKLCGFA